MKKLSTFLTSLLLILILSSFLVPDFNTNPADNLIASNLSDNFESEFPNPDEFNLEEFVAWVVSIAGAFLTTFIINILKKKFPDWFKKSSTNPK
jgi:hypothetical protein